jgi:hypothetical protein
LRIDAGVPDDYVATPEGYFHPSCVVRVAAGERVAEGGKIMRHDGTERIVPGCGYPHYPPIRAKLDADAGPPPSWQWVASAIAQVPAANQGIVSMSGNMTVPPVPENPGDQTLYFFPGLMPASESVIIQAVLGWWAPRWTISSWDCCTATGQAYVSNIVSVNVRDVITGSITGTGCTPQGQGTSWTIVTTDLTRNESATLTVADSVVGSPLTFGTFAFEDYNVSNCSQYPSAEVTLAAYSMYTPEGQMAPAWNTAVATSPACGTAILPSSQTVTIEPCTCGPGACGTNACGGACTGSCAAGFCGLNACGTYCNGCPQGKTCCETNDVWACAPVPDCNPTLRPGPR